MNPARLMEPARMRSIVRQLRITLRRETDLRAPMKMVQTCVAIYCKTSIFLYGAASFLYQRDRDYCSHIAWSKKAGAGQPRFMRAMIASITHTVI